MMPWQRKATRLLTELSPDLCTCHDPGPVLAPVQDRGGLCPEAAGQDRPQPGLDHGQEPVGPLSGHLWDGPEPRGYAAKHCMNLGESPPEEPTIRGRSRPAKVLRGIGAEGVYWPNGSSYLPLSPTEGGGHGDAIDFMLVDEGWKLVPHVMGGIRPAMIARPHSQMLIISTMGTVESYVWNCDRRSGPGIGRRRRIHDGLPRIQRGARRGRVR